MSCFNLGEAAIDEFFVQLAFCFNLGEAAVDEFFYSKFTFKLPFFFRFLAWKWLVS